MVIFWRIPIKQKDKRMNKEKEFMELWETGTQKEAYDYIRNYESRLTKAQERIEELEAEVIKQKKWGMRRRDDAHRFNKELSRRDEERGNVVVEYNGTVCGKGLLLIYLLPEIEAFLLRNSELGKTYTVTITEKK